MEPWDGKIREGHGIAFDGKKFYDIPPPEGGYGPYKVWNGREYVALIGKGQHELQHDLKFWQRRYREQVEYIEELHGRKFFWSSRKEDIMPSAIEVLEMIKTKLVELNEKR